MNIVVIIFFYEPIVIKGARYIYFIKYEIIVVIFKFIGNYKAEVINSKITFLSST
jgi:hypothetical protein